MKLRTLFEKMPPYSHNADIANSEVILHVQQVLQCNGLPSSLNDAYHAFQSMRNIRSMVLIWDRTMHKWKGCLYTPQDPVLGMGEVSVRLDQMEKRLKKLERKNRKIIDFLRDNFVQKTTTECK